MNKRGQLSIINLIFYGVILVPIGAIIAAIMTAVIAGILGVANFSDLSTLIVDFIVPFYLLGLIITFFVYVVPQFSRPGQP